MGWAMMRVIMTLNRRKIVIGAILLTLAILWVELAVGIFGSPVAGS
ncbi:MAG: hypothetical protein HOF71_06010 [Chloroflexi bacterium]|nr:hypothetical protein [Chloroflexota bacterium]MBT4341099.1 hypothetical protein [Chloroflexota bacterium]